MQLKALVQIWTTDKKKNRVKILAGETFTAANKDEAESLIKARAACRPEDAPVLKPSLSRSVPKSSAPKPEVEEDEEEEDEEEEDEE